MEFPSVPASNRAKRALLPRAGSLGGHHHKVRPRALTTQRIVLGSVSGQVLDSCAQQGKVPDEPPRLQSLCMSTMIEWWDSFTACYLPAAYRLPVPLLEEMLTRLIRANKLPDSSLAVLMSSAVDSLDLSGLSNIRNSCLRSIGFSCTGITYLNLSGCTQVNNNTVRCVLQGCSSLRQLYLDGCHRISDAGFSVQNSPFVLLAGCLSLETLSVQSCPQITESLVDRLQKLCRSLQELNMSHCKQVGCQVMTAAIGACEGLQSLNVSFLESMEDHAFLALPSKPTVGTENLLHLNVGHCAFTDLGLARLCVFSQLKSLHMQSCEWVTTEGLGAVLRSLPQLESLDLRNCSWVESRTLAMIAQNCPVLDWLNVSWCTAVDDDGMVALSASKHLGELHLVWCTGLTDAAIRAFTLFPSLRTLNLAGCSKLTEQAMGALVDIYVLR